MERAPDLLFELLAFLLSESRRKYVGDMTTEEGLVSCCLPRTRGDGGGGGLPTLASFMFSV